MYTHRHIPSSWTSFPPPIPSHPSRSSQSTRLSSLCYAATSHQLSILPMLMYISQCYSLNVSHPPFPHAVSESPFSMSVSIPALQIGSSVPFSKCHIYTLIYNICFSDLFQKEKALGSPTSVQLTQILSFKTPYFIYF